MLLVVRSQAEWIWPSRAKLSVLHGTLSRHTVCALAFWGTSLQLFYFFHPYKAIPHIHSNCIVVWHCSTGILEAGLISNRLQDE